jgi:hypothetical protein
MLENAIVNPLMSHKISATGEIFARLLLQPFEGLSIYGGYLNREQKNDIRKKVEANGGFFY